MNLISKGHKRVLENYSRRRKEKGTINPRFIYNMVILLAAFK